MLGRVFPDPLAGCQDTGTSPCSPNAQGNFPATQFIQYEEFVDALEFMNTEGGGDPLNSGDGAWKRYMEVLVLDGKIGEGSGTTAGEAMFPGNDLSFLEWEPKPEYVSAGLPTTTLDRKKSDLIVVRVTDERVPDAGKKRYTLALSIHGIERAGAEGGTRAMEDLVTAFTTRKQDAPILPADARAGAPSFDEVLKNTIIYFTYPNPDGWRRGSVTEGGIFYQRYNGNGVDLNRDWPDIGYSFRGYSGASEPETRAFLGFYDGVRTKTGSEFAAGDDLHGMPFADAYSFTLLPHGRHDYGKDYRIREAAKTINRAQYHLSKWSPIIKDNDVPPESGITRCRPTALGDACARMYAQTWGSVFDTIDYTTTGTLGDWFDSSLGLKADGIDNEMAFSHLDRNIVFEPQGEQLHVDGNKALIYAHLSEMLRPREAPAFDAPGRKGYVANVRLTREEQILQEDPNAKKFEPQADYVDLRGTADVEQEGYTSIPFTVYRTNPRKGQTAIRNGGMRVDVTTTNVQGIATGLVTLKVQCRGCDEHVGVEEDGEWVTVGEGYNQSLIYAQAGVTVAVNRPHGSAKGVQWRALVSQGSAITRADVHFTRRLITTDGATGGDDPPVLRGYDVANTDFFPDLNRFIADPAERFQAVEPRKVISGEQSLAGLSSLVLADEPLPGYTGLYDGEVRPTGPPTANIAIADTKVTVAGQEFFPEIQCRRDDATTDSHEFTIAPEAANAAMAVSVHWTSPLNDWDVYLQRKNDEGVYVDTGKQGTAFLTTSEEFELEGPDAGDYRVQVVNCSAPDTNYEGSITFTPLEVVAPPPSTYTAAEKEAWMGKLAEWVQGGGNLVLTDGALRALPELTNVPGSAIKRQVVYAGQVAFATASGATEFGGPHTLAHPLSSYPVEVKQLGARFNSGMRRQTFEPTPLGFAIQTPSGDDTSGARQYDVSRPAWEEAGGTIAATSVNSRARADAAPVFTRVTVGEIGVGNGRIRIVGTLLPQPNTKADHPLGIEPYALTYTGYILMRNVLQPPKAS